MEHHSFKAKCSHWGSLSGFGTFVLVLVLAMLCLMCCMTYAQGASSVTTNALQVGVAWCAEWRGV